MIVPPRVEWSGDRRATEAYESSCSPFQLRYWIAEQVAPGDAALNIAVRWHVDVSLGHEAFETAWQRLIERHEPLRTAFSVVDGSPLLRIEASMPRTFPVVDLRDRPYAAALCEAERLAQIDARMPFDLSVAPLVRVRRLIVAQTVSFVVVCAHRTICDAQSLTILRDEFAALCRAFEQDTAPLLPAPHRRFSDAVGSSRQRSAPAGSVEACSALVRLMQGAKQFELPIDGVRPRERTTNGAVLTRVVEPMRAQRFTALALQEGRTTEVAALAAFVTLLGRYTGEDDITIGMQVDTRMEPGESRLVGCFANTVPVRVNLSGAPGTNALFALVGAAIDASYDARDVPLTQLIERAAPTRDPSRAPLFSLQFCFSRGGHSSDDHDVNGSIEAAPLSSGSRFDLEWCVAVGGSSWQVSCEYNPDLFAAATIEGLLDAYCTLIDSMAHDPQRPVALLDILQPAAARALTVDANRTVAAYPSGATVPQLVAEQAARTPQSIALRCGDARLTYAQLVTAANRVAEAVVQAGCGPGDLIGIVLDRSTEMVAALLGVMQAGCTYVPLDPAYPADRLAFIASDAELGAIVTRSTVAAADAIGISRRIFVDDLLQAHETVAGIPVRPAASIGSDRIAYVIYTSGSTGKPKGVRVSHRSLVNLVWAMCAQPGITQDDIFAAVTTISFDIAGLELFAPLVAGAQVVIADERDVRDGQALLALLRCARASIMQATPVTWQLLIDAGWDGDPRLTALCGGEALSRPLADAILSRSRSLWNLYGPTETTIWSAASRVAPEGPITIGRPIANTQLYVLDRNGQVLPAGVPGELYIGGDGVAAGYLKRDDLTRERFVPDPFADRPDARMYRTGDIVRARGSGYEFLGRADHQIKLRGFRIELDEIVATLRNANGVADAVAIVAAPGGAEPSIVAYVTAGSGAPQSPQWPASLRAQVARFLPGYMIPAAIVVLDRMPLTPNGKIDRIALPPVAGGASTVGVPPGTPTELAVATIVEELLARAGIGRDIDLFALGFHSVLALRLVARISAVWNIELRVRSVFEQPTIEAVARAIDEARVSGLGPAGGLEEPIIAYHEGGTFPPLFFFHSDADAGGMYCRKLAIAIGSAQPFYAVAPHGTAGLPNLTSLEAMARDHVERITAIRPHGPYRLGGHCDGGVVAYEVARLLRARGDSVEHVVVSNAYAPARRVVPFIDAFVRRVGLDESRESSQREKLCMNAISFARSLDNGPRAVLRFLLARIVTLTQLRERARLHAIENPDIPVRPRGSPATRQYFAQLVAVLTYHPQPVDCPMTLFWSTAEPLLLGDPTRDDHTRGWRTLLPDVRVVSVEGGHNAMIQERIEEFGRRFAQCVDGAVSERAVDTAGQRGPQAPVVAGGAPLASFSGAS